MAFTLIEEGNVDAIMSVISIAEVMQGPLKKGLPDNALRAIDPGAKRRGHLLKSTLPGLLL